MSNKRENLKKDVLFIVPPNITYDDFCHPSENTKTTQKNGKDFGSLITEPPLGVISLSAYIKKKDLVNNIKLIDFNVELNKIKSFEYETFYDFFIFFLQQKVIDKSFDVIAVSSLFSTSYKSLIDIINAARAVFDKSFIIAGGNTPTVSYGEIFRDSNCVDAICYGEGEIALARLLESESMFDYVRSDNTWITRDKLLNQDNFEHKYIWDLDKIPFDYSVISNSNDYNINPTIKYYMGRKSSVRHFPIMTSRGCPFKCVFCASHATHGRKMRYESLERVKSNILHLKEIGVDVITIEDDHFMGDKKRAYQIIEFIGQLGLTAFFPNSLALYALTREMLEVIKKAGVNQLILAVESGSDRVLKEVMKKPLKLDIIRRVAKDCRELGIYTDCNILFGLPGETLQDMSDTREFLKTIEANWFRINVATPLIGSEMHDVCSDKGYLKGNIKDGNYKCAIVETEDFTVDEVQSITYDTNIEMNFVNNVDMRLGNYDWAIDGFLNTLKAKPDHAISHYYLHLCYREKGDLKRAKKHMMDYCQYGKDSFWGKFIKKYQLPSVDSFSC